MRYCFKAWNRNSFIYCFGWLVLFTGMTQDMEGQIEKTVVRSFGKNEGIKGVERYFIETNLRDTVRAGIYEIDAFRQSPGTNVVMQCKVRGQYQQNKKQGSWSYKFDQHQMMVDSLVDLKPHFHMNGMQISNRYQFQRDSGAGLWNFRRDSIHHDTVWATVRSGQIDWSNRQVQWQDKSLGRQSVVQGSIDEHGYLNGTWKAIYDYQGLRVEETRDYIMGFLVGYKLKELSSNMEVEHEQFDGVKELLEWWINSDPRFKDGAYAIDTVAMELKRTHAIVRSKDHDLHAMDSMMRSVHLDFFRPFVPGGKVFPVDHRAYFKTRQFKKKLSSAQMDSINLLHQSLTQDINGQLNKLRDHVLFKQHIDQHNVKDEYAALDSIRAYVAYLNQKLIELQNEHFSQLRVDDQYQPYVLSSRIVVEGHGIEHQFKSYQGNVRDALVLLGNQIKELKSFIQIRQKAIQDISTSINDQKQLSQLDIELKQTISEFIQKTEIWRNAQGNSSNGLYNSTVTVGAMWYEQYVQIGLDKSILQYEQESQKATKQRLAGNILQQIRTLDAQHLVLVALREAPLELDRKYTNSKQKRILKTVYEKGAVAWQAILLDMEYEQEISTFGIKLDRLKKLYDQLILISQDPEQKRAKEVEKALKKVTIANEIETVIGGV